MLNFNRIDSVINKVIGNIKNSKSSKSIPNLQPTFRAGKTALFSDIEFNMPKMDIGLNKKGRQMTKQTNVFGQYVGTSFGGYMDAPKWSDRGKIAILESSALQQTKPKEEEFWHDIRQGQKISKPGEMPTVVKEEKGRIKGQTEPEMPRGKIPLAKFLVQIGYKSKKLEQDKEKKDYFNIDETSDEDFTLLEANRLSRRLYGRDLNRLPRTLAYQLIREASQETTSLKSSGKPLGALQPLRGSYTYFQPSERTKVMLYPTKYSKSPISKILRKHSKYDSKDASENIKRRNYKKDETEEKRLSFRKTKTIQTPKRIQHFGFKFFPIPEDWKTERKIKKENESKFYETKYSKKDVEEDTQKKDDRYILTKETPTHKLYRDPLGKYIIISKTKHPQGKIMPSISDLSYIYDNLPSGYVPKKAIIRAETVPEFFERKQKQENKKNVMEEMVHELEQRLYEQSVPGVHVGASEGWPTDWKQKQIKPEIMPRPEQISFFPIDEKDEYNPNKPYFERLRGTVIHETGHSVFDNLKPLQKEWKENVWPITSPTHYGSTGEQEDQAESFTVFRNIKPNTRQLEKEFQERKQVLTKHLGGLEAGPTVREEEEIQKMPKVLEAQAHIEHWRQPIQDKQKKDMINPKSEQAERYGLYGAYRKGQEWTTSTSLRSRYYPTFDL